VDFERGYQGTGRGVGDRVAAARHARDGIPLVERVAETQRRWDERGWRPLTSSPGKRFSSVPVTCGFADTPPAKNFGDGGTYGRSWSASARTKDRSRRLRGFVALSVRSRHESLAVWGQTACASSSKAAATRRIGGASAASS
jgi:hypothetical protein